VIFQPTEVSAINLYKLMIGAVVPRPIGFIGTVSRNGVNNLAPYSFFNAFSADPPVLGFSVSGRPAREKDSLTNARDTGEFTVNIVSEEIAEAMNAASAEVDADVDEFALSGLTAKAGLHVKAPLVAEAKFSFECRVMQILPLGTKPTSGTLVLGEAVCIHAADGLVEDFRVDPDQLRAIGRMGGFEYCRTRDRFGMKRPGV
jgi:flavin reductase (DIM6/NTAB) family NADH-FMN oxidoreductase RutF